MLSANAETNVPGQVDLVDNKLSQQVQTTVAEVGKALLGKRASDPACPFAAYSPAVTCSSKICLAWGKTTLSYALAKALAS